MTDRIPEQEAYFASTRGTLPAVPPGRGVPLYADETLEQKYMRQTRNAAVFIAVIVGLFVTIMVVGLILSKTS
jgi:hypothetical protein